MRNRFKISVTYSQVTPESAAHGDFSECGYIEEPYKASLKDVINKIESELGYFENFQAGGVYQSLYASDFHTIDYRTATEQQNCVHIQPADRRRKYHKRAAYWLNKVIAAKFYE